MLKAITLVHKGALEIAVQSIRSFALFFSRSHRLIIHVDSSISIQDHPLLLQAAEGIDVKIVTPAERKEKLDELLIDFPKTRAFLDGTSFYTKLEIPIFEKSHYLFFDSDVIWLKFANNLKPRNAPNAFSTESWSAYQGILKPRRWIRAKTPRRVNSGLQYIGQGFPFQRMENFLSMNMFDKSMRSAGDQEIFAYLYNDMEYFHPGDFKRSRNGSLYEIENESCTALHFPGKMWKPHIDQIHRISNSTDKESVNLRLLPSVPFSRFEFIRMRLQIKMGESRLLARPLNFFRKLLRPYR